MTSTQVRFINSPRFAVVGASISREKYGNRILRWYQQHDLPVVPIHPKEKVIESIATVASVDKLEHPQDTAVSIITPPKVTLSVLQDCKRLGISRIWLQPGAEDASVVQYCKDAELKDVIIGPCLLVEGPGLMTKRSQSNL